MRGTQLDMSFFIVEKEFHYNSILLLLEKELYIYLIHLNGENSCKQKLSVLHVFMEILYQANDCFSITWLFKRVDKINKYKMNLKKENIFIYFQEFPYVHKAFVLFVW